MKTADEFIETIVTAHASGRVKDEIIVRLQAEAEVSNREPPPLPALNSRGRTEGNWVLTLGGKDLRPDSELSFDIIDEMLRDGMVTFVHLMKLAQIMTVFRSWRGWKVGSASTELAEVATANLRTVLPQMMLNAGYRSLADGVAMMELLWKNVTKYQLGLARSSGNRTLWTVAELPHLVDPRHVSQIKRNQKTFEYEGFVQQSRYFSERGRLEITVPAEESLLMPYNIQFRNMWGKSFLEPIYPYWFWFAITLRSAVRGMERLGRSDIMVRAPMFDTLPDPNNATGTIRAMDYMGNVAASLAYSNYAILPSDRERESQQYKYDLTYLKGDAHTEAIVGMLQELAQLMLRAGLSADRALTQSSGGVGSYNIGELHAAATSMHNQLILTTWMWYINKYFMPWYSTYNYGPDGPPIWLEVRALDPEYKKTTQGLMGTMGSTPAGQEAWWQIDTRTLFELSDIPLLSPEEAAKRKEEINQEALEKQEMFLKQAQAAKAEKDATEPAPAEKEDEETVAEEAYREAAAILLGQKEGRIPIYLAEQVMSDLITLRSGAYEEGLHPRDEGGKFKSKPKSQKVSEKGGEAAPASPPKQKKGRAKRVATTILKGGVIGGIGGGLIFTGLLAAGIAAKKQKEGEGIDPNETEGWPKPQNEAEAAALAKSTLAAIGIDIGWNIDIVEGGQHADAFGNFDPREGVLHLSPRMAEQLKEGDPGAIIVLLHEVAHSRQQIEGSNHPDKIEIPNEATITNTDIQALMGNFEGNNQLVTLMAASKLYGREINDETISDMSLALIGDNIEDLIGTGGVGVMQIAKNPYKEETATWAGLASKWQEETGENKYAFISESHDNAFSISYNRSVLQRLFPERMENFSGENQLPAPSTILDWLSEDGIDGEKELSTILQEQISD